jgi:hypothetical protein
MTIMLKLAKPWMCPACGEDQGYMPQGGETTECSCCHRKFWLRSRSARYQDCPVGGEPTYTVFIDLAEERA